MPFFLISAGRRGVRPGAELRDLGPAQPAAHARPPRLLRGQRGDQAPPGGDLVRLHSHAQEVSEEPSGERPETKSSLFYSFITIYLCTYYINLLTLCKITF